MLQILKQQRDRFKSQMLAQSARAEQQRALADEATQRLSKLERDNVALYEKIRFLQAWKPKQARSGAGAGAPRSGSAGAGGSAVEQQYGALYKNGLDPFAAFKKREREAGGSYIERRFVGALASRRFREIAALYLILLHGVVCVCVCVCVCIARVHAALRFSVTPPPPHSRPFVACALRPLSSPPLSPLSLPCRYFLLFVYSHSCEHEAHHPMLAGRGGGGAPNRNGLHHRRIREHHANAHQF